MVAPASGVSETVASGRGVRDAGAASESSSGLVGALPPGWEARMTPGGEVYYANNVLRTTQWDRPTA